MHDLSTRLPGSLGPETGAALGTASMAGRRARRAEDWKLICILSVNVCLVDGFLGSNES